MSPQEVGKVMEQVFASCSVTRAEGQKEYAGGEDAFGNFNRIAEVAGIPREQVLMVYLQKHIDGCWAWSRGHKSQRESVDGRIKDAIVYLVLLQAMAKENEACEPEESTQTSTAQQSQLSSGRQIPPGWPLSTSSAPSPGYGVSKP